MSLAQEIAEAVGKAWPNGYSHRDHFPQAVALIQALLEAEDLKAKRLPASHIEREGAGYKCEDCGQAVLLDPGAMLSHVCASHLIDVLGDCVAVRKIRRIRSSLAFELTARWQETREWRFLKRAKLEGGIDSLAEPVDRLSGEKAAQNEE
jgi:hypothetical protein